MIVRLCFERAVASTDEVIDALEAYLAELWRNGQIHHGHLVSRSPVSAYVDLPRADSLKSRVHSISGKKALVELERAAGLLRAPPQRGAARVSRLRKRLERPASQPQGARVRALRVPVSPLPARFPLRRFDRGSAPRPHR